MDIRIGDLFVNMRPEVGGTDGDDESPYIDSQGERTTPPGYVWRVTDLANAPDAIGIVCDATGGWINPTLEELRDPTQYKPYVAALEDALYDLLDQLEGFIDMGIPFENPENGFHDSVMTARRLLNVGNLIPTTATN